MDDTMRERRKNERRKGEGAENTTEFVNAFKNTVTKGPDLPMKFKKHCVTWFNETHALFIGGSSAKNETYFVDVSDTNNFRLIFARLFRISSKDRILTI